MLDRKSIAKVFIEKYRYASKREKIIILNEFIDYTGLNRNYAARVLRNSLPIKNPTITRNKIKHKSQYDDVKNALETIWGVSDNICGKRLVAIIPEMLKKFEKFDEYQMSNPIKENFKTECINLLFCHKHAVSYNLYSFP